MTNLKESFLQAPENKDLFKTLEIDYTTSENWEELLEIYDKYIEAGDENTAAKYSLKKAVIYDEMLDKPENALEEMKKVIENEDFNLQHLKYFETLSIITSKIYPLIEVYKIIAEKVDEDNKLLFYYKIAGLYIRKDDYTGALEYIEKTLDIDIDYPEALDLLDFIINKKQDDIEILTKLIPVVEKTENWDNLLKVIDFLTEQNDKLDFDFKIEIFNKKIDLYENLITGEEEALLDTLIKVYEIKQSEEYFEKIEYYSQMLDNYDKMVSLMERLYENSELKPFYAYKIGTISYSLLGETEKALKYLSDYTELAGEYYEDAFNILIEILNEREDYKELVSTYIKQIRFIDDIDMKTEIYKEVASIYENQLFKLDEAVKIYNEIIKLDPENIEHYFEVERLYEELNNWEELINIIDRLLNYVDDKEVYEKKKAKIYDEKIVNYSKAIEEYEKILENYGYADNIEIVNRIRELYKLENRFEDLKNFLEVYKDFVTSEDEIISINLEIADIYSEKFGDYQTAFEKLREILDVNPSEEAAIKKLLLYMKDNKNVREIYDYLDVLLDSENNIDYWIKLNQIKIKNSSDKQEQAMLCIKVGDIYTEREGDTEKAFPYYAKALQLAPSDFTYSKYKEYYTTIGEEERAVNVLKNIINNVEDENLAKEINLEIGLILFNDIEKREEAVEYLEKVIENDSGEIRAISMLDDIYSDLDKKEDLYRILSLKLETGEEQIETLYRLRDISLDYYNDKEKALSFLTRLYKLDEFNREEHRESIIAFMYDLKKYEQLSLFYEKVLDEEDNPEYMEALADIYIEHLNNTERAGELYEQILDITENRKKVLFNLEKVYLESEDKDKLIEILEEQLELLKDEGDKQGVIEVIYKLGKLYLEYSAQYEKGAKMFYYLFKAKYKPEDVINYLETYLDNEEVLSFISDTLKGYYIYKEEWHSLINLYKKELEFKDEDERIEVLKKIAEVYNENLENVNEAVKYYNEVFKLTFDYEYLNKIEELLKEENNFTKLAELYENYITELSFDNPEDKEELYIKLSDLYKDKLGKISSAVKFLLDGFNEYPSVPLVDKIINLYKEDENYDKVKEFYYKKLDIIDDVQEQTDIKIELSRFLIEKFRDFESAVDLLLDILQWEENNTRVIGMLVKLNNYLGLDYLDLKLRLIDTLKPVLTDNMEYEEVVSLFDSVIKLEGLEEERKLELMKDEVSFLFEVAEYDRGFDKYENLLFESKGNEDVLNKGTEYAELANDFDTLIDIYKTFLSKIKTLGLSIDEVKSKALEVYYKLGEITFKYLGDYEQAEKYFKAILDKSPSHLNSLLMLEELYSEQAEYEKLRDLYIKLLGFELDKNKKLDIYKKLAKLFEEYLYEENEAIKYYEKVIEMDKTDEEILAKLFDYYKKQKDLQSILNIAEAQYLLNKEDPFYLNRFAFYNLKTYRKNSEKEYLNKSIVLAEKSYSIEPNNEKTEVILIEAYKDAELYEKVVELYNKKLSVINDIEKKIDLNVELAKIYAKNLNNIEKAEECVNFINEVAPHDTRTLDVKEQILRSQEKWEELLELLEDKMNIVEGGKLNEVIFAKIKLLTEKFERYDEAEEYLKELVQRDPENRDYLFYGENIFSATGNLKEYFGFIKNQLPEVESLETKAEIMSKMGDIAYDNFKKEDLAVKCYNKALEYNEKAVSPIKGLKKIALDKQDFNMYADLLNGMLKNSTDEEYESIKSELIDIYVNKLNKPEKVIPFKEEEYSENPATELMLELIGLYSLSSEPFGFDNYYEEFFNKLKTDKTIKDRHIHMFNLGKAANNFGDLDKAKTCYETVNRLKMGFIPNQMALGKLLLEIGDDKGALKSFQLLQLNQSKIKDIELKKELFLNLARLRASNNDALRAKSMYKKLLELDPENTEAREYLGL